MRKDLTIQEMAEVMAQAKECLATEDMIFFGAEEVRTEKELERAFAKTIMTEICEEANRIIAHNKRARMIKAHSMENIKDDFKELVKEIKKVSDADPEDKFLKDILNCIKKGGF